LGLFSFCFLFWVALGLKLRPLNLWGRYRVCFFKSKLNLHIKFLMRIGNVGNASCSAVRDKRILVQGQPRQS
jgi:hypothetical protein